MEESRKQPVRLDGKTILVTGSPGFIGAALVMRLLRELRSGTVVSFDSMNDYYDTALKEYRLRQIEALAAASAAGPDPGGASSSGLSGGSGSGLTGTPRCLAGRAAPWIPATSAADPAPAVSAGMIPPASAEEAMASAEEAEDKSGRYPAARTALCAFAPAVPAAGASLAFSPILSYTGDTMERKGAPSCPDHIIRNSNSCICVTFC